MPRKKTKRAGRIPIPRERLIAVKKALLERNYMTIREAALAEEIDPVTLYDVIRSGLSKDPRARIVKAIESLGLSGIVTQRS